MSALRLVRQHPPTVSNPPPSLELHPGIGRVRRRLRFHIGPTQQSTTRGPGKGCCQRSSQVLPQRESNSPNNPQRSQTSKTQGTLKDLAQGPTRRGGGQQSPKVPQKALQGGGAAEPTKALPGLGNSWSAPPWGLGGTSDAHTMALKEMPGLSVSGEMGTYRGGRRWKRLFPSWERTGS